MEIELDVTGLVDGLHVAAVLGVFDEGNARKSLAPFEVVDALELRASVLDTGGLPSGPVSVGSEGVLSGSSLGQAAAAPPLARPGGGSLRPGFVEISRSLGSGGGS